MRTNARRQHESSTTHKPVTQQDIAERCGVHRSTVSFVFNDDPCIPEATAVRIRAVAAEMGYDPARNAAARRLIGRKYGRQEFNHLIALGFMANFHRYPYWMRLFQGVLDTLAQEGFSVVPVVLPNQVDDQPEIYLPILRRGEVDGVILQANSIPFLHQYDALRNMPIVSLLHAEQSYPSVQVDEQTGAYQAMRHLLDLGHHTVLHYTLPHDSQGILWPRYRLAGVRQAMEEFTLEPERALVYLRRSKQWDAPLESGGEPAPAVAVAPEEWEIRQELAQVLATHPAVTAILTINDADAIRVYYHLKALGIRVPDDISLIGCDDVEPLLDEDRNNILTTIHMPLREVGREAAQLMLRLLRGEASENETVILQPTLAVRRTTGPARR